MNWALPTAPNSLALARDSQATGRQRIPFPGSAGRRPVQWCKASRRWDASKPLPIALPQERFDRLRVAFKC
ncbi:MAG: hypothetical protein CMJ64_03490 [Planctomycetaceae bacterium]|nr:hypothetical protein [Planctomycetaceae bacterium]